MANIQLGSDEEAEALGNIEKVMRTDEIEGEAGAGHRLRPN